MKKLVNSLSKVAFALFLITSTATVTSAQNMAMKGTKHDTAFVNKNIRDNMMEIQMSKVGQKKGTSPKVKAAAAKMIVDHTQMLNDLRKLNGGSGMISSGMSMAATPDMGTGKDFDKAWTAQMLESHEAKVTELEGVISSTDDAAIKALATKALPKVKMHRDTLSKMNASM